MDYVSKVQIGSGEEVDIKDADAIHNGDLQNATQSAAGLMSAADKTKLDGITAGARPYTAGAGISISNGVISVSYGDAATTSF